MHWKNVCDSTSTVIIWAVIIQCIGVDAKIDCGNQSILMWFLQYVWLGFGNENHWDKKVLTIVCVENHSVKVKVSIMAYSPSISAYFENATTHPFTDNAKLQSNHRQACSSRPLITKCCNYSINNSIAIMKAFNFCTPPCNWNSPWTF